MGGTSFSMGFVGRVFYRKEPRITRILIQDLIRVIRGYDLWFLAFALSRITALLFLLWLSLRWTFVFWLCLHLRLLGLSDTLAPWLLLFHRPRRAFRLRNTWTFNSLLLLLHWRRRPRCLWCASSLALIAYLELLSLRTLWRIV